MDKYKFIDNISVQLSYHTAVWDITTVYVIYRELLNFLDALGFLQDRGRAHCDLVLVENVWVLVVCALSCISVKIPFSCKHAACCDVWDL